MQSRGAPLTNSSWVYAEPCAQHVLAQMLALERNLPVQLRNQDGSRDWRYLEDRFTNGTLTRRHVLLLGYGTIGRRMKPLLEAARDKRLLAFDDVEAAFRTLFGLVGRDVQTRLLLGDRLVLDDAQIARDAERASAQFLILYQAPAGS